VKYLRGRANVAQFWPIGKGFIFSLRGEGGWIKSLGDNGVAAGSDPVRLTDRFYLGEPEMRGFDIRGVGPRVLRQPIITDPAFPNQPQPLVVTDRQQVGDDALGGKYYYLGHAELEIPLGSGAREMGLRPSIFMDIGAVWGIRQPVLQVSPWPEGIFVPTRDPATGNPLFNQINVATLVSGVCTPGNAPGDVSQVTNPVNPARPRCLTSPNNIAIGNSISPFIERFQGDSWKPRISIGVGVNWNSPFGPFRIDFAHVLTKQVGDDTKSFTFNVGTQF